MLTPRTYEQLLEDIATAILVEPGPLSDFSDGSNLSVLRRAIATVLATVYADLDQAVQDSTLSTASGEQLDSHTASFGLFRNQGTLASGSILAVPRVPSPQTVTLAANSYRWSYNGLLYFNTADVTLTTPYTVIPVQATQVGSDYDLAPGNILTDTSGTLNYDWQFIVGSAFNAANQPTGFINGGSDRETDAALKSRFEEYINSLSDGTYRAIRAAILSVPDVESLVLKEFVPAVGWFTAYIDDGTDNPTQALIDAVRTAIDEVKALGIGYQVFPMSKTFVDLTVQLKIDPAYVDSSTTIQNEATDRIRDLLRGYQFGQSLYLSKIADVCHTIPGVIRVVTYLPAADVIANPEQVLRSGVVNVTAVL